MVRRPPLTGRHKVLRERPLVIGVGELLWDLLPDSRQLGGATTNFCYHAHALGAEALVVSRVGDDELGCEAVAQLRSVGMATRGITIDPRAPTGTVSVDLDAEGKPAFEIRERVAWDFIELDRGILDEAGRAGVICFGSTPQREEQSRAAIRQILSATPRRTLRVFDINLRGQYWSRGIVEESFGMANVVKLNIEELQVIAEMFRLAGNEEGQMRDLAERFDLTALALTKGAKGSSLLLAGEYSAQTSNPIHVADTVGAGDSFTAALALGLIANSSAPTILQCANGIAEFVCSQSGAMPHLPEELRKRIASELGLGDWS